MSKHLTPAEITFRLFGGPRGVSEILGGHEKTPLAWKRPSKLRDAGDIPSARIMRALLSAAAHRRIPLTAAHLVCGASEAEIAKLQPLHEVA